MKPFHIIAFLVAGISWSGCLSPYITTTWKSDHLRRVHFDRILVAGVLSPGDTLLRKRMELLMSDELMKSGFYAASAMREFGASGLSGLGEEETFMELCNNGTDAVLVFCLVDQSKEENAPSREGDNYPARYYYGRIWNYRRLMAEPENSLPEPGGYYWECILFNLMTLQPEYCLQSRTYSLAEARDRALDVARRMMRKITKGDLASAQKRTKAAY